MPQVLEIHALLRHVRRNGFVEAPEPLGFDEEGREILSFIEGGLVLDASPAFLWSDATLSAAGQLLRRYHEAQAGFEVPPEAAWSPIGREPQGAVEVLCHNDFTPYNTISDGGRLVGLIDFDLVAPGSRIWDLAWAAINWIPLFDPQDHPRQHPDPPESARRLGILCNAYGHEDRPGLVAAMRRRMTRLIESWAEQRAVGDAWAIRVEDHQPFWQRVRKYLDSNADKLLT